MNKTIIRLIGVILVIIVSGLAACSNVATTLESLPTTAVTTSIPVEKTSPIQTTVNPPPTTFKTAEDSAITVKFDPNPVPVVVGEPVHWTTILTETKGTGVTIYSISRQFYTSNGSMG